MKQILIGLFAILLCASFVVAHEGRDDGIEIRQEDGSVLAAIHEESKGRYILLFEDGKIIPLDSQAVHFAGKQIDPRLLIIAQSLIETNAKEKPFIAKMLLKNQRIAILLNGNEGDSISVGLATDEEAAITEVKLGGFQEPTLRIDVDQSLLESDKGDMTILLEAMKDGRISIDATGFGNKIKIGLMKAGLAIAGWMN